MSVKIIDNTLISLSDAANINDELINSINNSNISLFKYPVELLNKFNDFNHEKAIIFTPPASDKNKVYFDTNLNNIVLSDINNACVHGSVNILKVKDYNPKFEDHLINISESIAYLRGQNKEIYFNAENLFTGYKEDSKYVLAILQAAIMGGANSLILCDTEGTVDKETLSTVVNKMTILFPLANIGVQFANGEQNVKELSECAIKAGATILVGNFYNNTDILSLI